ncbi:MAG: hypothetical protein P8175_10035, partial [Deltaproteobacteria bacterium]
QRYTTRGWDVIVNLPSSVAHGKATKIEKEILNLCRGGVTITNSKGGYQIFDQKTRKIIVNNYRLATIAVKDIVWKDPILRKIKKSVTL